VKKRSISAILRNWALVEWSPTHRRLRIDVSDGLTPDPRLGHRSKPFRFARRRLSRTFARNPRSRSTCRPNPEPDCGQYAEYLKIKKGHPVVLLNYMTRWPGKGIFCRDITHRCKADFWGTSLDTGPSSLVGEHVDHQSGALRFATPRADLRT